ncbi:hypothetical protein BO71DRAFT_489002 [Aspergillus ellipticus CBS 707.79]|uniref:Uncharacterized protein n=1 Tax=Aspergillus ellipticus CBS 707.79 TaxID=1448320 RepID=A0A319CU95_9EURO|nr:hypothetical protein BO71DRAFT_489002 [Aspergillus ellipticus CBS 707.79]
MATTILQSFDQKLPNGPEIVLVFRGAYREFRSTVASTVDMDALRAYVKEGISVFQSIAASNTDWKPKRMCSDFLSCNYFIRSTLHFRRYAPLALTLICATERHGGPRSRFDVQWSLYSEQGALLATLAILEIKNTHIIHKQDFLPAESTPQNFPTQVMKAMGEAESTLLKNNAIWLSKQVGKYDIGCSDVAVFDWNAMFIFSYTQQHSSSDGPVKGTFFSESGQTKGMTFRRLLFAFVARPLKRFEIRNSQQ